MSKLIGTNPNQVPSNADLGTAAFTDSNDYISALSKINSNIAATAVDVFIYDTRKDSDGGAWRKRTQHTSWYNERLNTTTRGSRKEFPSVAVIVTTNSSSGMTIYDGDDSNLPMWMVFQNVSTPVYSMYTGLNGNGVAAMNAQIACSGGGFPRVFDFAQDFAWLWDTAGKYSFNNRNLVYRNAYSSIGTTPILSTSGIVNNTTNDIAITVLPNAPIDPATGLPVPTIAVACGSGNNGGVSVIKDNGSVVDITVNNAFYTNARRVNFLSDNSLGMGIGVPNGVAQESYYIFNNIPTSDNVITVDNIAGTTQNVDEFYAIQSPNSLVDLQLLGLDSNRALRASTGNSFASDEGLSVVSRNVGAPDKGLISYIASDYNTGWMPGNIKLAALSDTTQETVVGSELVTNGTFDSNTSGWSSGNVATLSHQNNGNPGGNINVASGSSSNGYAYQTQTTVVGKTYVLTFDNYHVDGSEGYVNIGTSIGGDQYVYQNMGTSSSWTSHSFTITATTTTTFIGFYSRPNGNVRYDNISFREAEEDRSVNGNGLQVFGTITKTPVATGADLVGYSNFSSGNYFQQSYSSNLDFGTGDISAMGWFKVEYTYVGTKIFFDKANPSWPSTGSGQRVFFGLNGNDYLYYYTDNGLGTTSTAVPSNVWVHACFVRSGTSHQLYMNGKHVLTKIHTASSLSGSGNVLTVGNGSPSKANPWPGQLALWRLSATAPSAEQVKKMYEDEKMLFQENAKATLYGTSDAVTALAYDDSTNLLHAGTSAGRSIFQGLRRIDNTTTAVGTAISASNGMVAEE